MTTKRTLPDGRILELQPQLYNVRLTVSLPELQDECWEDAWCYRDPIRALVAFMEWDGTGDDGPPGWNKHPMSGRWREDGTPATERQPELL